MSVWPQVPADLDQATFTSLLPPGAALSDAVVWSRVMPRVIAARFTQLRADVDKKKVRGKFYYGTPKKGVIFVEQTGEVERGEPQIEGNKGDRHRLGRRQPQGVGDKKSWAKGATAAHAEGQKRCSVAD